MTAARKPRPQQLRARLKAVNAQLEQSIENERVTMLQRASEVEQEYLRAEAARKAFVKEFFALAPADRGAEVTELAAAMGLSTQRLYQIKNSK